MSDIRRIVELHNLYGSKRRVAKEPSPFGITTVRFGNLRPWGQ